MKLSVFDMHCDTADAIYGLKAELYKNNFHISLERMREFEHYIQVMAVFIPPKLNLSALCFETLYLAFGNFVIFYSFQIPFNKINPMTHFYSFP